MLFQYQREFRLGYFILSPMPASAISEIVIFEIPDEEIITSALLLVGKYYSSAAYINL